MKLLYLLSVNNILYLIIYKLNNIIRLNQKRFYTIIIFRY